jgi:hypothetical protein
MVLAVVAALSAFAWPGLSRASSLAVTDAFDAQSTFKNALHRSIWESGLVLGGFLALGPWIGL